MTGPTIAKEMLSLSSQNETNALNRQALRHSSYSIGTCWTITATTVFMAHPVTFLNRLVPKVLSLPLLRCARLLPV